MTALMLVSLLVVSSTQEQTVQVEEEGLVQSILQNENAPVQLATACGTGFCGFTFGGFIILASATLQDLWFIIVTPLLTALVVPVLTGMCVNYFSTGDKKSVFEPGAIIGAFIGELALVAAIGIPLSIYALHKMLTDQAVVTGELATIGVVGGAIGLLPFILSPMLGSVAYDRYMREM